MTQFPEPAKRGALHLALLGVGIYIVPYVFAWVTLRPGYPLWYRIISFVYATVLIVLVTLFLLVGWHQPG